MKAIKLLQHEKYSIELLPEDAAKYGIKGNCQITMDISNDGKTDNVELIDNSGKIIKSLFLTEAREDLQQAKKNGSQILYAAIAVDQALNDIISMHLFGNLYPNPKRDYFINNILNTNHLDFASKTKVALHILDEHKLFGQTFGNDNKRKKAAGKKKKEFEDDLFTLMRYRNAFAHGELRYDASGVCVLEYYSNGQKTEKLTDGFWTKIEQLYLQLDCELCEFIKKLST